MSEQEEDVFKEIFVRVAEGGDRFWIQNAIVKHYSIEPGDGIRCVLKVILDRNMENAEKIDKEILIDVDDRDATTCLISGAVCDLYSIHSLNYLRILIKEILH
jgi:hypothetical protein